MRNCYKALIASLCDRSSAWTGIDAKYFDSCSKSMYVTQVVKKGTIKEANIDMTTYHTVAPYSVTYCYDLPLSTFGLRGEEPNLFVRMVYDRLGAYIKKTYLK